MSGYRSIAFWVKVAADRTYKLQVKRHKEDYETVFDKCPHLEGYDLLNTVPIPIPGEEAQK